MKLLLDEQLSYAIAAWLPDHDVFSVRRMGWLGIVNGRLLALAAGAGFDTIITFDKNMPQQQSLATLPLAIVVLHVRSNKIADLVPVAGNLRAALVSLPPRAVTHVYP